MFSGPMRSYLVKENHFGTHTQTNTHRSRIIFFPMLLYLLILSSLFFLFRLDVGEDVEELKNQLNLKVKFAFIF